MPPPPSPPLPSVQALNTLPFVMTMANCVCWTAYSFLIDDWYLAVANSIGFMIGLTLFMLAFGIGVPDVRARDRVLAVCVADAAVLFTVSIVERMVLTSQGAKEQLWGYTGACPAPGRRRCGPPPYFQNLMAVRVQSLQSLQGVQSVQGVPVVCTVHNGHTFVATEFTHVRVTGPSPAWPDKHTSSHFPRLPPCSELP